VARRRPVRDLAALEIDPVCGMVVDAGWRFRLERAGRTWWFCSVHYREESRTRQP